MSDDLKRLQAALHLATPPVDDDAKARAIAVAKKNFQACQGTSAATRLTDERPKERGGYLSGVKTVLNKISLRPALYATSSLAVIGLGIFLVNPTGISLPSPERHEVQKPSIVASKPTIVAAKKNRAANEPVLRAGIAASTNDTAFDRALAPGIGTIGAMATSSMEPVSIENPYAQNREQFTNAAPNPLKITVDDPVSTFSIDVDTASYAYVRSAIMGGLLPRVEAVRVEEMINYFPYDYPAPQGSVPFSSTVSVFQTPWNADTKLVHIGIQGRMPAVEDRPPLDLVFLIDTSGSMQAANKLPLLKQSFRLLLSRLNRDDKVSIVTYAGSSGVVLKPTKADDKEAILGALDRLEAGGSTAGQQGLQLAYAQAEKMHKKGRIGRILLATDGDFNIGISDPEALKTYVETKRKSGTYLSVLGFGRGNYNDALMQALAQNGNGTAAYIDTLSEAQKVLVDQVAGDLFPIANDVKIQVEFNPATVAEYRLIGYETRQLAREDFNNDKVDAGDIGAGRTVTAIYEVTPVGSPAVRNAVLRYKSQKQAGDTSGELGFLKLRYKIPGQSTSHLIETPIRDANKATNEARFGAAVAGFGQLLSNQKYLGSWGYEQAIALANASKGDDAFGYRAEAVSLMRLAESLSK